MTYNKYLAWMLSVPMTMSVYAQENAPEEKAEKMQVTGSRIKRSDAEGATSMIVIDREKIEASGFNKVADILRENPASTHGALKEESGRGSAASAGANIRGLGEEYTLVLVNGKRLANDAITGVADVNLIPLVAVERIEVIKEGASAVYGSDEERALRKHSRLAPDNFDRMVSKSKSINSCLM